MHGGALVWVFKEALFDEIDAILSAILEDFLLELRLFSKNGTVETQTGLAREAEGSRSC